MPDILTALKQGKFSSPEAERRDIHPLFFRLNNSHDENRLSGLLKEKPFIRIHDKIVPQLKELIKTQNPSYTFDQGTLEEAAIAHIGSGPKWAYGVWVYYPWNERLVHILDEAEFIRLRTNRNLYKITREERDLLATKKIGIIGLSVGQSVSLTLAMERSFGELRIADFDTLDLSNMNRLRTGLHNLGLPKTVIVAREIAEIDPFLKVNCYHEGITSNNMDEFFSKNGKIDLLVDECDGLDIKLLCRMKAREMGIPVVMDSSDRGMIDIERFDLTPDYPILHGLATGIDPYELTGLSNEDKVPYILKILDAEKLSRRAKASMFEVSQTITTWPQLASSVLAGGAITAEVIRRIFTNSLHSSGRYYIDTEMLIHDQEQPSDAVPARKLYAALPPLEIEEMEEVISRLDLSGSQDQLFPSESVIKSLIEAAALAPSLGNNQPWKWVYKKGNLILFHDRSRSLSFGDFQHIGSHISFGAAIENLVLKSHELDMESEVLYFPLKDYTPCIAQIRFYPQDYLSEMTASHQFDDLSKFIPERHTNRLFGQRVAVKRAELAELTTVAQLEPGACLQFIDDPAQLEKIGRVISSADRLRFLHPQGHHDFFNEMRWTEEENTKTRDGLDIATIEMKLSDIAGMQLAKDWSTIKLLDDWNLGDAFGKQSIKAVDAASAIGFLTLPSFSPKSFVLGGRVVERIWLKATEMGLAFQPLDSPPLFFARLIHGKGAEMPEKMKNRLLALRKDFLRLFSSSDQVAEVFLFRIAKSPPPPVMSLRKPLKEILFI